MLYFHAVRIFLSPEVFREACRGGRLESSTSVAGFLTKRHPAKTATFIVLSSGYNCQTPCTFVLDGLQHFAPRILLQSLSELLKGPGRFQANRFDFLFVRRSRYNNPEAIY